MSRSSSLDFSDGRLGGATTLRAAVLAAAAFAVPSWLPVAFALALIAGAPIAIERLRTGSVNALLATGMAAAALSLAVGGHLAAVFVATQAAPALLLAEAVTRGRGLRRGCAWAFWLLCIEAALALVLLGSRVPLTLVAQYEQGLSALKSSGFDPQGVELLSEHALTFRNLAMVIYPAAAFILAGIVAFAQAGVVRGFLARHDPALLEGEDFETLRLPFGLAVLFVLATPAVFWAETRPLAYNTLLVLSFFFLIQGLAVTLYYARRLAGPVLLRVILLLLLFINPWSPHVLALVGLFDTWFDFRRFAIRPDDDD